MAVIASWGTISSANAQSVQPKLIWDGTNWWAFYYKSGTADTLFYAYSTDLSSWTESSTGITASSSTVASTVTVCYDSATQVVLVTHASTSNDFYYKRGNITPGSHSISWAGPYSITGDLSGSDSTACASFVVGSDSRPQFATSDINGNVLTFRPTNVISTTFADTSWGAGVQSSGSANTISKCVQIPFSSLKFAGIHTDSGPYEYYSYYNGSTWNNAGGPWSPAFYNFGYYNWGVVKVNDNAAFVLMQTASTTLTFYKTTNQGSSWDTASVSDPTIGEAMGSSAEIALATDGTDVWAFFIRGDANNTVCYKKYTVGTDTWDTSFTNIATTAQTRYHVGATYGNGKIAVTWSQVNGSNYDLNVDSVTLATAEAGTAFQVNAFQTNAFSIYGKEVASSPQGSISDTLTETDALAGNKAASGSVSDTITESDAVTGNRSASGSVGDVVTISDALTRAVTANHSISDTLTESDAVTASKTTAASISDTITETDAVSGSKSTAASVSDSTTFSDATGITKWQGPEIKGFSTNFYPSGTSHGSQWVVVQGTVGSTCVLAFVKGGTDDIRPFTLTDTQSQFTWTQRAAIVNASNQMVYIWTAQFTSSAATQINIGFNTSTSNADTAVAWEVLAGSGIGIGTAATGSLDSGSGQVDLAISTGHENALILGAAGANDNPTVTLSPLPAEVVDYNRNEDTNNANAHFHFDALSSGANTVGFNESYARWVIAAVELYFVTGSAGSISDLTTYSDALSANQGAVQALSDTLTESDAQAANHAAAGSISDTFTETDALAAGASSSASVSDTITESDAVAAAQAVARSTSDTLTLSDALAGLQGSVGTVSDTLTVSDSTAQNIAAAHVISDALTELDAVVGVMQGQFAGSTSDTITFSDGATANKATSAAVSDQATLLDALSGNQAIAKALSDQIILSDALGAAKASDNSISDGITLTDTVASAAAVSKLLSDTLTLTDSVQGLSGSTTAGAISDTIALGDNVAANVGIGAALSDTLTITDFTFGANNVKAGTQSDTLTVTDSCAASVLGNLMGMRFLVWNGSAWV